MVEPAAKKREEKSRLMASERAHCSSCYFLLFFVVVVIRHKTTADRGLLVPGLDCADALRLLTKGIDTPTGLDPRHAAFSWPAR